MLNWSSFSRFNWRRFDKCCNFSNCLEPTLQFKKIIYTSDVIMSCSFHMIIHFVLVKFLHIFNLLFQTINFMAFKNHSRLCSKPNRFANFIWRSLHFLLRSCCFKRDLFLIGLFLLNTLFLLFLLNSSIFSHYWQLVDNWKFWHDFFLHLDWLVFLFLLFGY